MGRDALMKFLEVRGLIEQVQVRRSINLASDKDGNEICVVGRWAASSIVNALHEAGYEIAQSK